MLGSLTLPHLGINFDDLMMLICHKNVRIKSKNYYKKNHRNNVVGLLTNYYFCRNCDKSRVPHDTQCILWKSKMFLELWQMFVIFMKRVYWNFDEPFGNYDKFHRNSNSLCYFCGRFVGIEMKLYWNYGTTCYLQKIETTLQHINPTHITADNKKL